MWLPDDLFIYLLPSLILLRSVYRKATYLALDMPKIHPQLL